MAEAVPTLRKTLGSLAILFNDIDNYGYPASLPFIKEKLRSGGLLIIDNMLWHGRIFDKKDVSPATEGVREFTRQVTSDSDWIVSLIPARDGMIVAYKKDAESPCPTFTTSQISPTPTYTPNGSF